jgi:hypothetical protein
MNEQEKLFNDIKYLALSVDNLKGYVQNDFHLMIADGYITKEDLLDSLDDIECDFDKAIYTLTVLKTRVFDFVKKTAEEL